MFAGQVALVTGAAQGIGATIAQALTENGASVAALDRDTADVTDAEAVEEAFTLTEAELGPIDIVVAVAGVLHTGPVTEFSDADWSHTFAVNTTGVFHTCRAAARRMVPRRRGSIIVISSNAAGVPRAGMAAYAASKAAATMFTKSLGLELAPHGIRCNVIAPGSTDTPMLQAMAGAQHAIDGDPASFRIGIPLGRLADPSDIADAVLFLASGRARHITMHELYIDGGASL
ncbi:MAG TPA: 2,3-dihydro-2,3-dihydroxybenzoate dehydrogenase [Micromonosporaceae bacterium]|nr:2,3-dihydro-2,3-dihydroxybenzoate dehydrogenase [Micromonosporaceae bacterium]